MRRRPSLAIACLPGMMLALVMLRPVEAQKPQWPFLPEKWGPFRGQIVDVDTGGPLAGAAVLAYWTERVDTPVQTNQKFYEARETLSDATGRFEIPRLTPPFFRFRIFPGQIAIFMPGYAEVAEVVTPPDGQPFVASTEIRMRRLKTREELRKKSRSFPVYVPAEKMQGLIRAINVEYRMLGLEPVQPPPEWGRSQ